MFYNEEIAQSCPDTAGEEKPDSDTTLYISDSLNYLTGLGSGWLGDVWEKAKKQSSVAISATKRDLTEFVKTIHRDTSNAVSVVGDSALALTEKIVAADGCGDPSQTETSASIGGFFENLISKAQGSQRYTPFKDRLSALKSDPATYTTEPDACEDSKVWESTFNMDNFKDEISQLLVENSDIKKIHTKLVPTVVNYSTFWMRYFYRVDVVKKEEEKSNSLMNKETEYGWDSDSDIATPTNDRKKFSVDLRPETQGSPSSSISFQQIGSPDVADMDSDDSKNASSADSFVSIEEPDETVSGSISTKEILEQKIAMATNVKIKKSNDSSADTSSDSIMVIDPQDVDSSPPKESHAEGSSKQHSVRDFINNMTIGDAQQQPAKGNEEWPEWD